MIELLGVGVPRRDRGWLLYRVCATLRTGELTTVLSADAMERRALLDAITGRRVPDEGRVWIDRMPVTPDTLGRVRRLCGDVDPTDRLVGRNSVFWNALAPASAHRVLTRLLRRQHRGEREAVHGALERGGLRAHVDKPVAALSASERLRLVVARAMVRRPHYLVIRDPDASLWGCEVDALLALLSLLAHSDRLGVVVSLAESASGQRFADRVLLLREGVMLVHGQPDPSRRTGGTGNSTRVISVAGARDLAGLHGDCCVSTAAHER
jgi:ABC-type cobalamin/Fe3+-siderophores transport system ATPase subunit